MTTKNNPNQLSLASRILRFIEAHAGPSRCREPGQAVEAFDELALELVAWQLEYNEAYRTAWAARRPRGRQINHWSEAPSVPTGAFKDFDFTCLPAEQRTIIFHSSGTTGQRPSRHLHSAASLELYQASLRPWFRRHFPAIATGIPLLALTPSPTDAPHSSLVHMLDVLCRESGGAGSGFAGKVSNRGDWVIDLHHAVDWLQCRVHQGQPLIVAGTAFNFVHLLDAMAEAGRHLRLPAGSAVMETGGYKGRSRTLPRDELHALITSRLGVETPGIVCEYGMCELSSQAYDGIANQPEYRRIFRFPPWARSRVVSPETGQEVHEGESGLLQAFDLANAFSVFAVQTEDLAIRRADGFELIGRGAAAEPRGCSLMAT